MCQKAYQFPKMQGIPGWVPARFVEASVAEHGRIYAMVYEEVELTFLEY